VFNGMIYVFHQGGSENGQLWYSVFDGKSWEKDVQVPNTGMSGQPGAIVFGDTLSVFHQGWGNNGQLWYNEFDGNSWNGDTEIANVGISAGPSAVEY
jgi:hypothetical protein